jgi:quercetin dioxygenase-like cupin family protein
MSTTAPQTSAFPPIALQPGEGEARWFLGSLITVKSSRETTDGTVTVVDNYAVQGLGSPLHVHHNEDEWFYVTEGELTFWVGGDVIKAPAGSFVYGPRGIPHTFLVSSPEARFLLVTEPAGFEGFMRELSEPARALTLPPDDIQPPSPELMMATAAKYGLEILGPPGIPA